MNTKAQKLCECGCGQPAPIATRNWHTKGIKKGEPLRFVCGHHRKGKLQSKEEKIKRVKSWGIHDCKISPYLPDNKVVRYNPDQKRWYCCHKTGSRKPHARLVYEQYFGKIPKDMVVHHKSGSATEIEDDRPENLMLLSQKWNWHYMPRLAEGFNVPEKLVTEFYCECKNSFSEDVIFQEVCRKLLQYKEVECQSKKDIKTQR